MGVQTHEWEHFQRILQNGDVAAGFKLAVLGDTCPDGI